LDNCRIGAETAEGAESNNVFGSSILTLQALQVLQASTCRSEVSAPIRQLSVQLIRVIAFA
jgi:hypothetical protein